MPRPQLYDVTLPRLMLMMRYLDRNQEDLPLPILGAYQLVNRTLDGMCEDLQEFIEFHEEIEK